MDATLHKALKHSKRVLSPYIFSLAILSFLSGRGFLLSPAYAGEPGVPSDMRVALYLNYYFPDYTNTPLGIRRNCDCELGYQTGITLRDRLFWKVWFNFHGYVLGGPGLSGAPEQYGTRFEGHLRFKRVTLLVGHRAEWNIDHPSDMPVNSKEGNYMSTGGLRETYLGLTWLLY